MSDDESQPILRRSGQRRGRVVDSDGEDQLGPGRPGGPIERVLLAGHGQVQFGTPGELRAISPSGISSGGGRVRGGRRQLEGPDDRARTALVPGDEVVPAIQHPVPEQAPGRVQGKYRHYCFTWNNYPADAQAQLAGLSAQYVAFQPERGAEGTRHLQGTLIHDI